MDCSTPGSSVLRHFLEFAQIHIHWVGDAIQPSQPLSPASAPALNLSQRQGLSQWVSSSHQVAKILELQLQHQSFQWTLSAELLRDWRVIEGTRLLILVQGHPVIAVCNTTGHWLCPIYFYAILSLVKNGRVLPFPPFPNWKRKGTDKPEFNLLWQLSQSSYSEGGPAHRRGMTLSHPRSRQRRPGFSPSVFSHVGTYWPRCLPIHILMGKRERRTRFFFFLKERRKTPDNKTWTWLRGKKGSYFDCRTVNHWYHVDTYISLLSS